MMRVTAVAAACLLATVRSGVAENWPGFRGPTGQGYTAEKDLPVAWGGPSGQNVLWRAPLVGQGHASPIVWGQRVFVCTALWPPSVKKPETVIPEHHVLCYDADSGKRLWDTRRGRG